MKNPFKNLTKRYIHFLPKVHYELLFRIHEPEQWDAQVNFVQPLLVFKSKNNDHIYNFHLIKYAGTTSWHIVFSSYNDFWSTTKTTVVTTIHRNLLDKQNRLFIEVDHKNRLFYVCLNNRDNWGTLIKSMQLSRIGTREIGQKAILL